MKAIVCIDENWGIGKNNNLLFNLPEDMKRFREETSGKVAIMGYNTFKSLPNGPLKNRINIVLDDLDRKIEGAIVVSSLYKLVIELSKQEYKNKEIFVIGGAAIYKLLVPFCDEVLVTKVLENKDADRFFPNLDQDPKFKCIDDGEVLTSTTGLKYRFTTYKNIQEKING